MKSKFFALGAVLVATQLSGCMGNSGGPGGGPVKGLATPTRTGTFEVSSFNKAYHSGIIRSKNGGGVAYLTGDKGYNVFNSSIVALAGVMPQTRVSSPPPSGTVEMSGTYEIAIAKEGVTNTGSPSSNGGVYVKDGDTEVFIHKGTGSSGTNVTPVLTSRSSGTINVAANFDRGTFAGRSTNGELVVDGDLSGSSLSGEANFRGLNGTMKGLVGADEAVVAVAGGSSDVSYAGGFVANSK